MTTTHPSDAFQIALANCAREQIRTPGSIQPQGFMVVVQEPAMLIRQVSENLPDWLGVEIDALLGVHFDAVVQDGCSFVEQLGELDEDQSQPYHVADVQFLIGQQAQRLPMMLHRHDQVLIAEFQRPAAVPAPSSRLYPLVRSFVGGAPDSESIDELCERAVRVIKRLTGFGRVKSYRFDTEGNGLVNAELVDDDYPSYKGLCFPASDIPAQARALYCANRIRVIEDADYQPARLLPAANLLTGQPLDLSFSTLRSVSPVHLQYMRNMQTWASMSVSIVVEGRLWGLVSCHHRTPRSVSFQVRTACELLGRVLSLQIETREAHLRHARMLEIRQRIVQLLGAIADQDSVRLGLRALPDIFTDFVGAAGAAVVSSTGCDTYGHTPPQARIMALVGWLTARGDAEVFHTDNAGRDIPHLAGLADMASGILAVSISELHPHYLIWFKPQQSQVVHWAGRPEKSIAQSGSLNPRESFEQWQQIVEGFSTPWDPSEVEGVQELRQAILGIVLRKAEELAQLSESLEKTNKELEAFSYSVSHDLRAPLRHIAGYAELLSDAEGANMSERSLRFLGTIENSAKFAGTLVDNLLSFSQMGRCAMHLSDVNLSAMVASIKLEMLPDYEGRDICWTFNALPIVVADPAFLHLALRNLIANAIKYTRGRPVALIEVDVQERDDAHVISVRDNGVGFDMQYANKLFGVFQRLHRMEEFEGTGIGLANVRRIIERHGGTVWAHGVPDQGATFYFSLPKKTLMPTA
ncbi:ATPase [Pseudomonas putida]|uniref:ATP-binding protein n=1 Tax=Pseudomonas TaxID=286 RepID=UPI0007316B4A|nr:MULTISPECIES: ATP-binding protein [Pseudomonas]KTC25176.1 ATPase [Pseudomonas putida]WKL65221.1 ATP-binding protein [Pseudomonas qingdaonensis]